jgi:hypothetical protein
MATRIPTAGVAPVPRIRAAVLDAFLNGEISEVDRDWFLFVLDRAQVPRTEEERRILVGAR